jgi:hypothetical protein
MTRLSTILFVLVLTASIASAGTKQWVFITITNGTASITDTFGVAIGATNCLDPQLGESQLPPPPPVGAFDTRFVEPECGDSIQGLSLDFHGRSEVRDSSGLPFEMKVQRSDLNDSASITLQFSHGWQSVFDSLTIVDASTNGLLFSRDMHALNQDTATLNFVVHDSVYDLTDFLIQYRSSGVLGVPRNTKSALPKTFALAQNYPNPFNPTTNIGYALSEAGQVTLAVYNTLGSRVALLVNGREEAGTHSVSFASQNLSSGVYFYRISVQTASEVFSDSKKLVLLK